MELVFKLTKAAAKNGGDRYETTLPTGDEFVIYFPQVISRKSGTAATQIVVTLAREM